MKKIGGGRADGLAAPLWHLVLGFQGLPYQMPLRCLIGTASWCLCDAGDRRVAQRYIDFAFGLGRRENWDRIGSGDRASAFTRLWLGASVSGLSAVPTSQQRLVRIDRGSKVKSTGCDSKARSWSWSRSWSIWRLELGEDMGWQALPVLVWRACSLSPLSLATGLQVRSAQSRRKSWSLSVCCMSDRPVRAGRTRMHVWSPSEQQRIDSSMPSKRRCLPSGAMAIAAALPRALVGMCALCQCRYAIYLFHCF